MIIDRDDVKLDTNKNIKFCGRFKTDIDVLKAATPVIGTVVAGIDVYNNGQVSMLSWLGFMCAVIMGNVIFSYSTRKKTNFIIILYSLVAVSFLIFMLYKFDSIRTLISFYK